jgi:hypothetical protein
VHRRATDYFGCLRTLEIGHDETVNLLPTPEVTIADSDVEDALGRAVAVINPLLDVLWGTDPFGLKRQDPPNAISWALNAADIPGTLAWDELSVDERIDWWVWRVGALNTVAVAFPGVLGVIGRRLPIQDLLGFASQAIVLCAVARELGVTDRGFRSSCWLRCCAGGICRPGSSTGIRRSASSSPRRGSPRRCGS